MSRSLSFVGSRLQMRCSPIIKSPTLRYTWHLRMQQSFLNMAIEVGVAMDALESSRGALFIGIDFCESSRVQLSELTGVLQGSLLKKESSNASAQYIVTKSILKIFELKITKIYLHEHLIHEYFYARKFPDLQYTYT